MAKYGTFKYGTAKYGNNGDNDILWLFYRTVNDILNDTDRNYINYTDLNRIETRMQELTEELNKYKYVNHINTKTDWKKQISTNDLDNIPLKSQLDRIKNNLNILVNSYYIYSSTPNLPDTLENLNIYKINDIEKILYDINVLIKYMIQSFIYVGNDYNLGGL